MKVLKSGSGQKGWSTKATCTGDGNQGGGCGAKLLVEEPDVFKTMTGGNYGGDSPEPCATFKCPECGVLTDLKNFPHSKLMELPHRRNNRED
jgi:hypothetical protein